MIPNWDDHINAFSYFLPTDYTFNIHWNYGIDFSHLMVWPSYLSEPTDKTTILKFNYTENRETYDIF
jgi:hypothetical protein